MPTLDWKVGMHVVNVNDLGPHYGVRGKVIEVTKSRISVARDDGQRGSGPMQSWTVSPSSTDWAEVGTPVEPPKASWSYGEADRLYDNAVSAINAYNEYIAAKPGTSYYPATTPGRY